jgi:hypothetical protein
MWLKSGKANETRLFNLNELRCDKSENEYGREEYGGADPQG